MQMIFIDGYLETKTNKNKMNYYSKPLEIIGNYIIVICEDGDLLFENVVSILKWEVADKVYFGADIGYGVIDVNLKYHEEEITEFLDNEMKKGNFKIVYA
jgi:hypothetical protein